VTKGSTSLPLTANFLLAKMLGAFDDKSAARRMPRCSHHLTSKSSVLFRVVRRREQQETRGLLTAFFTRLEGAFF
jgi:hypothetical protein